MIIISENSLRAFLSMQLKIMEKENEEKIGLLKKKNSKFTFPIIDPSSNFRLAFDALVFICILYNGLTLPALFSFQVIWESGKDIHTIWFFDYVCDVVYIIDIILNFRTAYLERGIPKTTTKEIVRKYISTWFIIDVLSVFPMDLFSWRIWKHSLLRLNRLLKIFRIQGYFESWEKQSSFFHLIQFWKLISMLFLFIQWLGCIYISLAYLEHFEDLSHDSFLPPKELSLSFWKLFQYSLFTSTRLVTKVGGSPPQPTSNIERGYLLLACMTILFIATAITAAVIQWVKHLRYEQSQWRSKVSRIKKFMGNMNISLSLSEKFAFYYKNTNMEKIHRIIHYYDQLWSRQQGLEEQDILEDLPKNLRTEVSLFINGEIIRKVPFFSNANTGFIKELVNYMNAEIYSPGEFIFHIGDLASDMYFIRHGKVDVIGSDNTIITSLEEGSFFGEIGLLYESKRSASIRASTYCDIYVLRKIDLDKVLKRYPEQQDYMILTADQRITNDSLRDLIKKFHKVGISFQNEIIKSFKYETVNEGDILYEIDDDESDFLYFVGKGHLDLLDSSNKILRSLTPSSDLKEGAFFGHIDFVLQRPRTATAVVKSRCVVAFLSWEDFKRITSKYPSETELVYKSAQNHSDRICATFGRQTIHRTAKTLWKRAYSKVRLLRRWAKIGRDAHSHDRNWFLKLNSIKRDLEDCSIKKEDALKAHDLLSEYTKFILQMISSK